MQFLVDFVIGVFGKPGDDLGKTIVFLGGLDSGGGNDRRSPGLVDQNGVDLVDDGEVMAPLGHFGGSPSHIIAQIIETELVVGAVGNIREVGFAPAIWAQLV